MILSSYFSVSWFWWICTSDFTSKWSPKKPLTSHLDKLENPSMQSMTADILKPKQLNSFMSRCINSVIGIFDQNKQLSIKIKSNSIIMNLSKRLKLLTLENQMNRGIQLHPFSSLSIILELYTLYVFNFRFRWRFNHFQMTFCAVCSFFSLKKGFFWLTSTIATGLFENGPQVVFLHVVLINLAVPGTGRRPL